MTEALGYFIVAGVFLAMVWLEGRAVKAERLARARAWHWEDRAERLRAVLERVANDRVVPETRDRFASPAEWCAWFEELSNTALLADNDAEEAWQERHGDDPGQERAP